LKYGKIVHGILDRRVNRFIAEVYINGLKEQVHIKNTGRLKELLLANARIMFEHSDNPNRKTRYSLISVE
jgi:sugar fermentation stimulation protein A